jgi:hypothetical protein
MKNNKKFDIKHEKGIVTYAMRTGKVFVKSTLPLSVANSIVKRGKDVEISDKRGYGQEICVDDTYFFPVVEKSDGVTE